MYFVFDPNDISVVVASPHRKAGQGLLDEDIENDTSGDFKRFLISAAQVRSGRDS